MLIVLNSRFFASFIERRLQTLAESFTDEQDAQPTVPVPFLERAGAKCFTLMLSTARTVAASSSSRLHSPVAWSRKSVQEGYYDLEAGETERTPLLYVRDNGRYRAKSLHRANDPNRVHPVALGLMVALLVFLLIGVVIGVYLLLLTGKCASHHCTSLPYLKLPRIPQFNGPGPYRIRSFWSSDPPGGSIRWRSRRPPSTGSPLRT